MKFWRALERLSGGAVMWEWSRELGSEIAAARPFLRVANDAAKTHPCTNMAGCGCPHRIEEYGPGQWLAVCDPEEWCAPFVVTGEQLLVFELDTPVLCAAIAGALGWEPPARKRIGVRASLIGTFGQAHSRAYLMFPGDSASMAREVERLFCAQTDAFVLFTPTGLHCSPEVESALRRQSCVHMPLAAVMGVRPAGKLAATKKIQPMLEAFERGLTEGKGLVKTVERIDRNIEAVAQDKYELRKENEELRQLNKDGYFNFAIRVKGEDFLAFAVIMALGNRKAAAAHLKIPHRTFYNRVEQWAARGKDYQLMLRYMEWRKRSSRHLKVQLNPSLQSGDAGNGAENPETLADVLTEIAAADNKDYPAMFADVLQALERQNAGNWMAVRQELVEMIKEDVMQ